MLRQVKTKEYLPPFLQEVWELAELCAAQDEELNLLWNAAESAWQDRFLYHMTGYGIGRWEKILNIVPKAGESLEERRLRIISRLNSRTPYTWKMVEEHLKQLCADSGYTMKLFNQEFLLYVRIALTNKERYQEIKDWLTEIIPLNLILDISLNYNTHKKLAPCTHRRLAGYTHKGLRETVLTEGRKEGK